MLRYVPLYSLWWILSNLFLHCWDDHVVFVFCRCGISHWLISICWIFPVTLGWIQLGHGVWPFFNCVLGFGLLIFCWGFLQLYSSKILSCNFLFGSVFDFSISVMVASQNDFGNVPFSYVFWKSLRRIVTSSSLYVWQNFLVKSIGPELLFAGSILNYRFYFTSGDWATHIICFFLIQFWQAVCF